MTSDRWTEIERIYNGALEREPGARAAFLDAACAGDEALRLEVASLLEHEPAARAFLERPALEDEAKRSLAEPLLGERDLDGYAILSLIGAGGMGEIYRARDLTLGREVALKVLARPAAGGSGALRRFEAEARLASALNHPNIVTIYGVGEKEDVAYIAMELVRGRTLREILLDGPLPLPRALGIAAQLADALAVAHAHGIVHRDLKPENLMVTPEGRVKVLDFGIAKLHGSAEEAPPSSREEPRGTSTATGTVLGTIGYMSPEQAAGRPADPASDQFSFGAILYEMLSGRRAFQRDTPAATLDAILREEPQALAIDARTSPALADILARCLAKTPGDRFPDTRELAEGLRRIAEKVEHREASRPQTRRRLLWLGTAAAIAVAAGFAVSRARPRDTGIRSVAVLPFRKLAGGADAETLADGLTRGVTRGVSRLSNLIVRPRSAALHFGGADQDPREAGRKLAVDAVVRGTVSQETGRATVAAELVDVRTGARLWKGDYEISSGDGLSVPNEIARAIVADGIRLPLSAGDRRELARRPTDDPTAYDLYLRAVRLCERGTEADYLEARALLQKAVARDPNFALAYVALATTHSVMTIDGYESPAAALPEITRNVRRALDSDQDLPDAHSEAAVALFYFQWDWQGAEKEWRQALASRGGGFVPDFLSAYALQKWALGDSAEALALARRARELDPLSLELRLREADLLMHAGSLGEAADEYESVLRAADAADPDGAATASNAWLGFAEVRRRQGRFDEAIAARRRADEAAGDDALADLYATARGEAGWREIERRAAHAQLDALRQRTAAGGYASPLDFARVYARLDDREQTFRSLEKALAERSPGLAFLNVDTAWDSLRADPRFLATTRRVGLPTAR